MVKSLCRMGNPILRQTAREVSGEFLNSDEFNQLITDMKDSMKEHGGIGLAAPQIGVSLQIAIVELMNFNRYGQEINFPMTVFINPKITMLTTATQGFWEGCLSVPGLRGYVERPQKVRVSYLNEMGQRKVIEAEGFLATVFQHELDHLFGKLYLDHIKDPSLLSYQEEFELYIQNPQSLD